MLLAACSKQPVAGNSHHTTTVLLLCTALKYSAPRSVQRQPGARRTGRARCPHGATSFCVLHSTLIIRFIARIYPLLPAILRVVPAAISIQHFPRPCASGLPRASDLVYGRPPALPRRRSRSYPPMSLSPAHKAALQSCGIGPMCRTPALGKGTHASKAHCAKAQLRAGQRVFRTRTFFYRSPVTPLLSASLSLRSSVRVGKELARVNYELQTIAERIIEGMGGGGAIREKKYTRTDIIVGDYLSLMNWRWCNGAWRRASPIRTRRSKPRSWPATGGWARAS